MNLVQPVKSESGDDPDHLASRHGLPIDRAPVTLSPRDTLRDAVATMIRRPRTSMNEDAQASPSRTIEE